MTVQLDGQLMRKVSRFRHAKYSSMLLPILATVRSQEQTLVTMTVNSMH